MAISIFNHETTSIELDEYIEFIDVNVDVSDVNSITASAYMLERLAQNKKLLINIYKSELKSYFSDKSGAAYSPSSAVLGRGKKKKFIVRANLWPPLADTPSRSIEQEMFSYNLAHDHNFDFLTANYFGSGYTTEIWEYPGPDAISGHQGECVEMKFSERTTLHSGKQIFYRRCRDIHIQYPPADFSASINLMAPTDLDMVTDQYIFDLERQVLKGHPAGCPASRRVHLLEIAGALGNEETAEVLLDIARSHPCQRSRAAALRGALQILPTTAVLAGGAFGADQSYYVREVLRTYDGVKTDS